MALYIVRVPNGKYSVFDDLELSFVRTGLLYGEVSAMVMAGRQCSGTDAMSFVWQASTQERALPMDGDRPLSGLTLDAMLWAIELVCGSEALARELSSIACACYAPAPLETAVSDDLVELCEAYDIAVPCCAANDEAQPVKRKIRFSSAGRLGRELRRVRALRHVRR